MEIGKRFKKSVEHGHNDKKHKWLNVHTDVVFLLLFFFWEMLLRLKVNMFHITSIMLFSFTNYKLTKHMVQLKPLLVIDEGCVCIHECVCVFKMLHYDHLKWQYIF